MDSAIEKPVTDTAEYKYIQLDNKLDVVLVSDKKFEKAACSLSVNVGSFNDYKEVPGIAHFLEHMLFLGSEKYSEEDFNSYLTTHGGSCNAFTSQVTTNYHFDIVPNYLDGMLDRFANIFICPMFDFEATNREIEAVHSEFCKGLLSDENRLYQLLKLFARKENPFQNFEIGNRSSLALLMDFANRSRLMQFYKEFYSANVMKLSVVSTHSIVELEFMVRAENRFAAIRNNSLIIPSKELYAKEYPAFEVSNCGKLIKFIRVKDVHDIRFMWILSDQHQFWRKKPSQYLIHLMGHEGEGSLFSRLKKENLATELVARIYLDNVGFSILDCQIFIMEGALNKIEMICGLVFEYVKMLQTREVEDWILNEIATIRETMFHYETLRSPIGKAIDLTNAMSIYNSIMHVNSAEYLIFEKDRSLIKTLISQLNLNNLLIILSSKNLEKDSSIKWETEFYYGTKYNVIDLPESYLQCWKLSKGCQNNGANFSEVGVFVKNPYIPRNLSIKAKKVFKTESFQDLRFLHSENWEKQINIPKIQNSEAEGRVRIFFLDQIDYMVPKLVIRLILTSNAMCKDLKSYTAMELYIATVLEDINEVTYNARLAGLNFALGSRIESIFEGAYNGFEILIAGFNDKAFSLFEMICKSLGTSRNLTEKSFNIAKTIFIRNMRNMMLYQKPMKQAQRLLREALVTPIFLPPNRLNECESLNFEDIRTFENKNGFMQIATIEGLFQGNLTQDDMSQYLQILKTYFTMEQYMEKSTECSTMLKQKVYDLKSLENIESLFPEKLVRLIKECAAPNPQEENSAAILTIFLGNIEKDIRMASFLALCKAYLYQPFFDSLRTKQQLGYSVHVTSTNILNCVGLSFMVQSSSVPAREVLTRIEGFLEIYLGNIRNILRHEEFQATVEGVILNLKSCFENLSSSSTTFFSEIALRRYQMRRNLEKCAFLRDTSVEDFYNFLEKDLIKSPWIACIVNSPNIRKYDVKPGREKICDTYATFPATPENWIPLNDDIISKINTFYEFPNIEHCTTEEVYT